MSLTYAFADLHGRFDLLTKALTTIAKHSNGRPHKVIALGDYVDRGPQSCQIIQQLMDDQAAGLPFICIQGNHEAMMLETILKPLHPGWWIGNGGGQTLISYGHPPRGEYCPDVVPKDHLAWMGQLPKYHVDKFRVFVHAGVAPQIPMDQQREETLQWFLYPDRADVGYGNNNERHVVHGHHQFADGPILLKNRTDLDTFAWFTGRLVIGVFDDEKAGGPVDLIEVKGAPYARRAA